MKKCSLGTEWHRSFFSIVMMAMLLIITSCADFENSQSADPSVTSTEISATSTVDLSKIGGGKCASIDEEIKDRYKAFEAAYAAGDVDLLYNDFWSPDYYEYSVAFDKNREEMRQQMISYYANGGTIGATTDQLLERNVYNDVAYDIASFNMDGTFGGSLYALYRYQLTRWIKGADGKWRVDKHVAGPRGNTYEVNPNEAGEVICYEKQAGANAVVNQDLASRFDAYINALTTGNADEAYKFWTEDFHFYGNGLDTDRDGLYQYYTQFFQTGSIISFNSSLSNRFMHGNIVYDIMLLEATVVKNGVQSIKKSHYVIRWQKGRDGVWRITRLMDMARGVAG
jgi:ketosteroid isomerase-like protein